MAGKFTWYVVLIKLHGLTKNFSSKSNNSQTDETLPKSLHILSRFSKETPPLKKKSAWMFDPHSAE